MLKIIYNKFQAFIENYFVRILGSIMFAIYRYILDFYVQGYLKIFLLIFL